MHSYILTVTCTLGVSFFSQAEIASVTTPTSGYNQREGQSSPKLTLQKGEYYNLEAYHYEHSSSSNVEIGVAFHQTQWTHSKVDIAQNEKQKITTVAVSNPEVQVSCIVSFVSVHLF